MTRGQLVIDDVNSDALNLAADVALQLDVAYWLITPRDSIRSRIARTFVSFLRSEALMTFEKLKGSLAPSIELIGCRADKFVNRSKDVSRWLKH